MSETYFSKLDPKEKVSRLIQLGTSKGQVTIWIKGQKEKYTFYVLEFDKSRLEIILDTKQNLFIINYFYIDKYSCTFINCISPWI